MEHNGGSIIGEVLAEHGVKFLFTLCGGHISPILVGAKERGIRVIDVRDEASAVFAADATARMTGIPGVAAVTAGPGVTNAVTAVKNAQMAQSPVLLFGGAAATVLRGRGSLQDIDQLSIMRPITKWARSISTVASLRPTVERALQVARSGVPGPVFLEVPIDLLYPEQLVKSWYLSESGVKDNRKLATRALELYLRGHLYRQFHAPNLPMDLDFGIKLSSLRPARPAGNDPTERVAQLVRAAERPALIVGSQAIANCRDARPLAEAIESLGIPTWLGGAARGLLGRASPLQFRHKRTAALKQADLVLVAGFPFDFRLGYGRAIGRQAKVVAINLNAAELRQNRKPDVAINEHPGEFLRELATIAGTAPTHASWFETVRDREQARDAEIAHQATTAGARINPLQLFLRMEQKLADNAVLVVDGGDFVATAAYILRPRSPLSWMDPGVFGTLGVGGGFAVGAAVCRPDSEVWIIYGDGSCAYSLAEFDTFVRHGVAPIAVVGTDASWAQIAREQAEILGDDVGTVLRRTDYHKVAEGFGGRGLLLTDPAQIDATLDEAKRLARAGTPVLINVHIEATDFRKGSVSV